MSLDSNEIYPSAYGTLSAWVTVAIMDFKRVLDRDPSRISPDVAAIFGNLEDRAATLQHQIQKYEGMVRGFKNG